MKSWFATALATTLALSALTSPAMAAPAVKLGKPAYGGPGCPAGTASASVTGGGTRLTVKFSQYQVAAGGSSGNVGTFPDSMSSGVTCGNFASTKFPSTNMSPSTT